MQTNLQQIESTEKKGAKFTCAIPTAVMPFLEKAGITFRKTGQRCALSNMTYVEIEINVAFDITCLIYAGWEHGFDDHRNEVKRLVKDAKKVLEPRSAEQMSTHQSNSAA
jgi:hypothetical protein